MIVVDTNVIAYLYLDAPKSELARDLLTRDSDWAAPTLWRSEFRNVLVGAVRRGEMGLAAAQEIMADALLMLTSREYVPASSMVLEAAVESGCTAYDSEFAVLARVLQVSLVTEDRALLRGFPDVARAL